MFSTHSPAKCVKSGLLLPKSVGLAVVALSSIALLTGCPTPPDGGGDPVLSVSPGSPSVSAAAGTTTLSINNVGGGTLVWSAQVVSGNQWITILSASSGTGSGNVVVGISEHASPGSRDAFDAREGVVRITSDSSTRDVTITQDGDVADYNLGFDDGFADDGLYFTGFDDSLLTMDTEVLWQGFLIDFIDDLSFDAGKLDGEFTAYNDGFFVAYRYAFIIGFSEGYDSAFAADYLDFLANDVHLEFGHGGFPDGYNDGFSEGRIFGAADYEAFFEFDWLAAFLEWESGIDLNFDEIPLGTGEFGPVVLYEYGTDPLATKGTKRETLRKELTLRGISSEKQGIDFARTLTPEQIADLDVMPTTGQRGDRTLTLDTTWLERIEAFNTAGKKSATERVRTSRVAQ